MKHLNIQMDENESIPAMVICLNIADKKHKSKYKRNKIQKVKNGFSELAKGCKRFKEK